MTSSPIVIVGAGLAGLSAACHLRGRGHDVTVLERADGPGGWARPSQHGEFRFDGGPTVVTMPDILGDTFAAVGADRDSYCKLERLDPFYTANFADGSRVRLRSSVDATASEMAESIGPLAAEQLRRFAQWLGELYDLEFATFIDRDVRSVSTLLAEHRDLVGLARHGGFGSWQRIVEQFFDDDRLRRLFSFQAMYAGLSPTSARALFAVIAYMDSVGGVYYPVGGVGRIAEGLAEAASDRGVRFHYDTNIDRIDTRRPRPVLHLADGEELEASAVIVTADRAVATRELLNLPASRREQQMARSPSCVVWHIAGRGPLPPGTSHHNIHFGTAWTDAFADLFDGQRPMADPSRFVTVASTSDADAAPPGGQSLYVLEPVPNLGADVDWTETTPRLTERMLDWADETGYPVADAEVVDVIDPPRWRHRGAGLGTPFSVAHRFFQSGPFRPDHEDRRAPGVVFAGAGTRPGVGIPMVLISGRLAADRVAANLRMAP